MIKWMGEMASAARQTMADPDFWKLFALFAGMGAAAALFFWLAMGFDVMALKGACRKLGDWEALTLFVSPFAVAISAMVAAGELLTQMELKKRWKKRINYWKVLRSFGMALLMLGGSAGLMMLWC